MDDYAIYLRKSRKDDEAESHGEGDTLARHKRILHDYAHKQGLNITDEFQEVVSGDSIDSRPEMQKLLKGVSEEKWRGVLVVEIERLARGDTADQGRVARIFKLSETLIITPNKTFDPNNEFDEEYFEFGLFMSRRELKTITRRLQRGRMDSIKEGKYPGNAPPYGYTRVKLEKEKGWILSPIDEEAAIIKLIFDWYTTGVLQDDGTYERIGVTLIARRLNKMQIASKKGGDWTSSSVRDILINPHYIGMVRWNWRPAKKKVIDGNEKITRPRSEHIIIAQGRHQAIVQREIFDLAQELIKKNPVRPKKEYQTTKNAWAGVIVCGKCGRMMTRRPSKTYPDILLCQHLECKNVSSQLATVEKRILEGLSEWLSGYKIQWSSGESPNKTRTSTVTQKAISKLQDELNKLDTRRKRAYEFMEDGAYTRDEFITRTREIAEQKQLTEESLSTLQAELALEEAREAARSTIIPLVEKLLDVYHELPTPATKNNLIKEVLEKVVYTKENGGRWHNSPDDFTIELFPKLPKLV